MSVKKIVIQKSENEAEKRPLHELPSTENETEKRQLHELPSTENEAEKIQLHELPSTKNEAEKRQLHELPSTEIVKSGTFGLASGYGASRMVMCIQNKKIF